MTFQSSSQAATCITLSGALKLSLIIAERQAGKQLSMPSFPVI